MEKPTTRSNSKQTKEYNVNTGQVQQSLQKIDENAPLSEQERAVTELDYEEEEGAGQENPPVENQPQVQEQQVEIQRNEQSIDRQTSAVSKPHSGRRREASTADFHAGLNAWVQRFVKQNPDCKVVWDSADVFDILWQNGLPLSNKQFSITECESSTLLAKLPTIESPADACDWFFQHYLENIDTIKSYLNAVTKGTVSTARFKASKLSDLPISAEQSALGQRATFPRPEHLGKPFGPFNISMFEPHIQYLEQANNKGKIAELKFARNIVAYLLEATVHNFNSIHLPWLPLHMVRFLCVQTLNLLNQYEATGFHLTDIKLATHPDKSIRVFAHGLLNQETQPMLMSATHKKIFDLASTAKQKELKDGFKSNTPFRGASSSRGRGYRGNRYNPYYDRYNQNTRGNKQHFDYSQKRHPPGKDSRNHQKD